jgi:CheY-like chemotaxis protein/MinD-like ATPase involved in chromosome partitioning or flagellar assembly
MSEKILIVDDDIDSLKLIGLMLQRHGYEVIAANAGNQALSKAVAELPNLIILDVMMPDMDGYEVCRRLRSNNDTKSIPIIMFTAKTLVDDKVAGFEAGADDYLTKPTHPAELASRVKAILSRNTNQRREETKKGVTIGVVGAKGGVGTTTIALNLAAAAMMAKENPIIADFRLGVGSLGLSLGVGRSSGMATVLSKAAGDIRPQVIEKELVTHQSGLRALLSSINAKERQLEYPSEALLAVVRSLRLMGRPAVFDLGYGFNSVVARVQREMDLLLVVVEPDDIALAMAHELLEELSVNSGGNTGHFQIIMVNRSQSSFQTAWHEVEQMLGQEIRAIISPGYELAFQANRTATPMVLLQPNAIVSSQIIKLAEDLNTQIRLVVDGGLTTS